MDAGLVSDTQLIYPLKIAESPILETFPDFMSSIF
jgi:hypothetical protein